MTKFTYTIITIAIIFLPVWLITLVLIDNYDRLMNEPWEYVDSIQSDSPIDDPATREDSVSLEGESKAIEPINGSRVITATIQIASWYDYSLSGYPYYSRYNSTCASRDYPRETILKVINLKNGKSVECRVNDWIEHPERDIDLSSFAFKQIGLLRDGLLDVKIIEL